MRAPWQGEQFCAKMPAPFLICSGRNSCPSELCAAAAAQASANTKLMIFSTVMTSKRKRGTKSLRHQRKRPYRSAVRHVLELLAHPILVHPAEAGQRGNIDGDRVPGIGHIHDAVVDERLCLFAPLIVEAQVPHGHQALDVRFIDLLERAVAV